MILCLHWRWYGSVGNFYRERNWWEICSSIFPCVTSPSFWHYIHSSSSAISSRSLDSPQWSSIIIVFGKVHSKSSSYARSNHGTFLCRKSCSLTRIISTFVLDVLYLLEEVVILTVYLDISHLLESYLLRSLIQKLKFLRRGFANRAF